MIRPIQHSFVLLNRFLGHDAARNVNSLLRFSLVLIRRVEVRDHGLDCVDVLMLAVKGFGLQDVVVHDR